MNFAVKHGNKISTFSTYDAARAVAILRGGTLHRILGKQDRKLTLGRELSLDEPKD